MRGNPGGPAEAFNTILSRFRGEIIFDDGNLMLEFSLLSVCCSSDDSCSCCSCLSSEAQPISCHIALFRVVTVLPPPPGGLVSMIQLAGKELELPAAVAAPAPLVV